MKGFQFILMDDYKVQSFLNVVIHDSHALIIIFEADGPLINNWEYFHGEEINQAFF